MQSDWLLVRIPIHDPKVFFIHGALGGHYGHGGAVNITLGEALREELREFPCGVHDVRREVDCRQTD